MSGANKKQQRKAELTEGLTQRQRKDQAEAQAAKRKHVTYGVIGVVCAVAVVALLVWNNFGSTHTGAAAAAVDGVEYSVADLQYYYTQARNNEYYNYQMYSYYGYSTGFNPNLGDGEQWYNEADGQTYADYFRDTALDTLKETAALCAAAKEAGYTLSADGQASIDDQLSEIDLVCAQNRLTRGAYFAQVYGNGVSEKVFLRNLTNDTLASEYAKYHQESYSYDDAALDAYYDENAATLDSFDYRVFTVDGSVEDPTDADGNPITDADGNTVTATDEEKQAAMAEAKETADAAVADVKAAGNKEQAFLTAAKAAGAEADDTLRESVLGSSLSSRDGSSVATWLQDSARKAGDVTAIEGSTSYQVVLFQGRSLNTDPTVNVRHILIRPETTEGAETNAQGAVIPSQEQMDAAKAEAQAILEQWNAMPEAERTPEAFGALAEEHSDDGGSNTNGGRYAYVYEGQMVPHFNAWIFDSSRQPGDVDLVENSGDDVSYYGWHLIYFEGQDIPYWKATAIQAKQSADQSEWLTALTDAAVAEPLDGMKYVGPSSTAEPTPSATPAASTAPEESDAAESPAAESPAA